MLGNLIRTNRSYRQFSQQPPIDIRLLRELIDLARLSASAANLQPLKYIISCDERKNALILPHLAWAGYLKDFSSPAKDLQPTAYIIILGDTQISKSFGCDHGIAAQSILLGATEKGFGGCMIGSIQRPQLREALDIPQHFEVLLVIAMGKAAEKVVIDNINPDGDIKYWRDSDDVHHVPKRRLDDIIIS